MSLFRRASSSLATLAFRAVRSPVSLRSGAVSAERLILRNQQLSRRSVFSFSRFSPEIAVAKRIADENLVSVLESEIECAVHEEAPDENDVMEDGTLFPFEIIDTPGEGTLFLTRKFEDETIQVEVSPYDDDEEEEEEEEEEEAEEAEAQSDDEDEESSVRIPMVVSVSKGDDGVCLEFGVTGYADETVIDTLSIKQPQGSENEGACDFEDLNENLQKAFHRFLEIRGIKPSFTRFLADHVANKDSRVYLQWLKDVKSFVEK
ncbi:hypothetical protein Bca52824_006209 [Brassica carinata]|uniref:Mitochondrial glycoprotein n=1 Tax=Brassica carinata TaxID=52824 RepID=A0A8X7WS26_BRACI|nr:hypothetical protein Bca52824_006209 [Brassica carinata]